MRPHFHRVLPALLCANLLADFSVFAADTPAATNAPLPRTDAHGNPLRRAPTGHISNYDESKVGNYTLPDPLVLADGQPVRDAKTWFDVRRPQLLKLYADDIYGRVPADTPKATFKVVETDTNALGGFAIHRDVEIRFGKGTNAPVAHLHMYLPPQATKPVPLLLHIVFFSNPPFPDGTASTASAGPARRFRFSEGGPITNIFAHGYGYATFKYSGIQPDRANSFRQGVIGLTLKPGQTKPAPDQWGAISAWAWGASRVLDYLETDPAVDAKRVALIGHSRLGKTVLLAGARDPRFALIFSSCGGEMGSALARRDYGETIDDMAANFPWQFCGNFQKYSGHWNEMPVDAHELIALNAPHPVFITGGTGDQWSDPRGEFLAEVAAGPVYELLGLKGLGTTNFPPVDTPLINGDLGWNYHTGPHAILPEDWNAFLDFADKYFKSANAAH
jgi:(4-O-methyl)-D-glucuronate---lignin esterase